jgi:hypothetical protein
MQNFVPFKIHYKPKKFPKLLIQFLSCLFQIKKNAGVLGKNMFMTIRFLWYPENPNYKIIMPNNVREIGNRLMSSKPTDVKIAYYQSKFNDYFNNVNMNSKYDVFAAVDTLLNKHEI